MIIKQVFEEFLKEQKEKYVAACKTFSYASEEFSDSNLSNVGDVRLDKLNKKYHECISKINKKITGDKK